MKEKMKLTELTKDELRHVTGGMTVGASCDDCDCSSQQSFGNENSHQRGGIVLPPIFGPF